VYIDTEGSFIFERVAQIAQAAVQHIQVRVCHMGDTAVHFLVENVVPGRFSYSGNELNYAWFHRPPVREAEPVQNLLGDRPGSVRQNGTKGLTFWADASSFCFFPFSLQS
jgi:hypothetical protein